MKIRFTELTQKCRYFNWKMLENLHSHISSATNNDGLEFWYWWWLWLLILDVFIDCIEVGHSINDRLKAQSSDSIELCCVVAVWCIVSMSYVLAQRIDRSWSVALVIGYWFLKAATNCRIRSRCVTRFAMSTQWKALLFSFFMFNDFHFLAWQHLALTF